MSTYTNSYFQIRSQQPSQPLKSIGLVLNETGVYFEGVKRPLGLMVVNDTPPESSVTNPDNAILEQYFNDIYNLFLSRLTGLVVSNQITSVDSDKIKALLNEIIKVRGLIDKQN